MHCACLFNWYQIGVLNYNVQTLQQVVHCSLQIGGLGVGEGHLAMSLYKTKGL